MVFAMIKVENIIKICCLEIATFINLTLKVLKAEEVKEVFADHHATFEQYKNQIMLLNII